MKKTLILLVIGLASAFCASGQTLSNEQKDNATHFLKRITDATSLALQGVGYSDYKLAVEVAGYYRNDPAALPDGQTRKLLTKIYLSHLDALVVWALYNGADPGPMFSANEFQRDLLTRYGVRARISKGNRPARDTTLRTIWRIQTRWEQSALDLLEKNGEPIHTTPSKREIATANQAWPSFWRAFLVAINSKDRSALKKMMPEDFYDGGGGLTPTEWLEFIDENEKNGSWRDLQRSFNRGTVMSEEWTKTGTPTRVTKDNGYYFEYRKDGRWYFAGIVGD